VIAKFNGTDALPLRAGASTDELVRVARAMQDEGRDAVEISRGHYDSGPSMVAGDYSGFLSAQVREGGAAKLATSRRVTGRTTAPVIERAMTRTWPAREGFNLPHARQFTQALEIPVICVGGFRSRDAIDAALIADCDAISSARAMIADPYLYQHLQRPDPAAPVCGFCNGCIARAGGRPVDCYSQPIRQRRDQMLRTLDTTTPQPATTRS
jgi:2,4-dienoyl-CoA reductase-like NADH-dependent reductase (Old Yellow Enzyme family)